MANLNNLNRFEFAPVNLDIQRSRFKVPHTHKTTFTAGKLIPIGLFEVLPSDTFELDLAAVCRMITPVAPTMDNSFLDVYAFFVPNRIACAHPKDWEKICGENVNGFWAPATEATLDNTGNTVSFGGFNCSPSSIGAYMGLPINTTSSDTIKISRLPLNGYKLIWNEWFRDQNTQPPMTGLNDIFYWSGCLNVNKFHDYFTTCLPSPQKGAAVTLSLGDIAPVTTDPVNATNGIVWRSLNGSLTGSNGLYTDSTGHMYSGTSNQSTSTQLQPDNLVADLSAATATTINQLRQAFAIQRMLEKDARGGSRYREILKTHYGSNIPDNTIQIPQYLGGKRIPLNITQVLQTSSTNEVSPLGTTGAFSNSSFSDSLFIKSFDEHGYIHVVACVRNNQTYSQGVSKMWTRNRRYDWYYPSFANLGEQAVLEQEIYFGPSHAGIAPGDVFGYQEAWAEYRYIPNRVSGYLAPAAADTTLTAWTYTNYFTDAPVLNSEFMYQPESQIGDTLVVTDSSYQFIADFYFNMNITRAMPTYSIPGLIDHH